MITMFKVLRLQVLKFFSDEVFCSLAVSLMVKAGDH